MEELITQAFLHVDVIGPHVREGHYDLMGPTGEIILPAVWEHLIEPDMSLTMTMWPMGPPPARPGMQPPPPGRPGMHMPPPPGWRPGMLPPPGRPGMQPPPLPPGWRPPDMVSNLPGKPHKKKPSGGFLSWLAGGQSKKSRRRRHDGPTTLKAVDLSLKSVIGFPTGSATLATKDGRTSTLQLVLFKLDIQETVQEVDISVSCKVARPSGSGDDVTGDEKSTTAPSNGADILHTGFFWSTPFTFEMFQTEKLLKSSDADHGPVESFKFLVPSARENDMIAAVLLRRWHSEVEEEAAPANLSVVFDILPYVDNMEDGVVEAALLNVEVNVTGGETTSWTPFSWSAAHGWEDALRFLLQETQEADDINHEDNDGRTPFSWAAGNGHGWAVDLLAEQEHISTRRDHQDRTPLSWAAGNGHVLTVEKLLIRFRKPGHKMEIDEQDTYGRTPLSYAAKGGHVEVVEKFILLGRDFQIDLHDNKFRTPLSYAAEYGHGEVVSALLEHAKNRDVRLNIYTDHVDNASNSPVSWAAKKAHDDVVRLLLSESPQLPASLKQDYLHRAAKRGWVVLTELLLKDEKASNMVDVVDEFGEGRTPLCIAAENGHADLVRTLINKFSAARDHRTTGYSDTPLMLAIRRRHDEVVKALVDAGADPKLQNASGESAVSLARDSNHLGILSMVLAVADADGGLAETAEGHPDFGCKATVIDFVRESGGMKPDAAEYPVAQLLEDINLGNHYFDTPEFRWIHLPANNVSRYMSILLLSTAKRR
jgi:ankyrin repeat protein